MTSVVEGAPDCEGTSAGVTLGRKEKRKALKKLKRKEIRKKVAISQREEEEAVANDPEEQLRIRLKEREEQEAMERERKAFEERERLWLLAVEENRRNKLLEASNEEQKQISDELCEDDDFEYAEEGPAEIIWKGNEIIVKKKRIRIPKRSNCETSIPSQEDDWPTSNPLPPFSPTQETLDSVAQQVPNFGTEQDKAHCPFHLKTGACRFGARCSRVHFYPDKSSTLLIKNMYAGPGLSWDHDEGLEFTDEEVERGYEEFYEDVHTEFLKFGELVNFKVCRNSSSHLRGNVYIHYKNVESSVLAYNSLNGRYYAGKQITCEFVNISRWKIAICGEYIKSRLKNCSRGSACNFIHCFRNPGGDYEWADWDKAPPKYWMRKMAVLFDTHHDTKHDAVFDRYNRSSWHNRSPSSCSSEDDSDGNRNLEGHRRNAYALTKRDPSSERCRSHRETDRRRTSRQSLESDGDLLKSEKESTSHPRKGKGKVRRKKSDDEGGRIRADRNRRRSSSEKRCKDANLNSRHKLDDVCDQKTIFHDRYKGV